MVTTCHGDDGPDTGTLRDADPRWHAGMSFGLFGTELVGTSGSTTMERHAASVSLDYRLSPQTTVSGGAGVGIGGLVTLGSRRFTIEPGWLVTASWSRRFVDGRGKLPFVLFGVSAGGSGAGTREQVRQGQMSQSAMLYAFDIRASVTVGKTFFDTISPYASLRAFGGPILWNVDSKTVLAGDRYHVQFGGGMVTALPRGFDLYAEVLPLGERAVTLGGGRSF